MKRDRTGHQRVHTGPVARTGRRHSGFTLAEVLLAVLLGSAVVTVTAVVAVQSVSIQRVVESELADRWEQVRVLGQFEADMDSELVGLPDSVDTIVLPHEPDRLVEVIGLSAISDSVSPFRQSLPARIVYSLKESHSEPGQKTLLREVQYLTDSQGHLHRQILTEGLLEARVEQHSEGNWTARPVPGDSEIKRPDAVRMICRWSSNPDRTVTRTVIIPNRKLRTGRSRT